MCVSTEASYHKCKETCTPVMFRHIGNTPRYTVQPSANEYIKDMASFIWLTKQQQQQQQKYCNSFESVYDSETKTDQVQLTEYCNKEDLFIYNILNSLLKSVNYCM